MSSNSPPDLEPLASALNEIASLYQFRSLDTKLYSALTVSQSYCLRSLYFKGPRTMTEISKGIGSPLSTITGLIDQLENRGLVERLANDSDRRSLRVHLTGKGRRLYGEAHTAFLSYLQPLARTRTRSQLDDHVAFLGEVMDAVRKWQKKPDPEG